MKLLIDSADTSAIKNLIEYYPIDGVTTNPTILAKSKRQPYEVLKEIRAIIKDKDLHAQVISDNAHDMICEAKYITHCLGQDTFVKIPVTQEGLKAIGELTAMGIKCTGTAVYTVSQAFLAAKAGAVWIAPYVNRIDNISNNGVETVKQMLDMFKANNLDAKILGASFHHLNQITPLMVMGAHAATLNPEMIYALLQNKYVDDAVKKFTDDFKNQYGKDALMM